MMDKKKTLILRFLVIAVLIVIGVVMAIIGRGHTVYIDNKTLEYDGVTYEAYYRATVSVDGEQIGKLGKRERSSATCIGQQFTMTVTLQQQKDGEEITQLINIALPYNMDGIIINLPGFLAGLPQEAWMTEFVSTVVEEEEETTSEEGDLSEFDME